MTIQQAIWLGLSLTLWFVAKGPINYAQTEPKGCIVGCSVPGEGIPSEIGADLSIHEMILFVYPFLL